MSITIEQIKSLRERTGVSTMACKKALQEASGDEEKAIELLRKKGASKAAERSDRATVHGVVAFAQSGDKVAMLALGCETDFVAKNDDFVKHAQTLAEKLLEGGEDTNLDAEIADLNIQMGEKVEIANKKVIEGPNSTYKHMNNKIGVLVQFSADAGETGNDIAMHIAAMNPKYVSPEAVSQESVDKEKEIWAEQLKEEGKPEQIIGKIMEGKEKKFREENALLTQAFVKNSDQQIADLLDGFEVVDFWRFEV
jgi:elongation factor Ts